MDNAKKPIGFYNYLNSFLNEFNLIDDEVIEDESSFYEDEEQRSAFETGMIRGESMCLEWAFYTLLLKFIYFLNEKEINDDTFSLDDADWNKLRIEFIEYFKKS